MLETKPPTNRKARFDRVFPRRIHLSKETLRLLGNCAVKSNYIYSQNNVEELIKELADIFIETAKKFNLNVQITFNPETPSCTTPPTEPPEGTTRVQRLN